MTEVEKRVQALQERTEALGVDLIAIGPTANMRYLIGFYPHADERLCLLLISPEIVNMVVPALNAEDVAAHTDLPMFTWPDAEGPAEALKTALAGLPSVTKLAIDGAMRADFLLPLLEATTPQQTRTVEPILASIRARKSPDEVEKLARAAAMADRAMAAAVEACRPGVAEREVAWAVEQSFRADGAPSVAFTLIASGPHASRPHHHSGERQLQEGDAIVIDIGAPLDDYQSDITRTIFLGEPPDEFRQAYQAVLEANEKARAAVRPGVPAEEIDRAARSPLEAAGYGEYFIHRTGHGLGLEVHEPPWIMAGNGKSLQEGMVFSIEPGVYFPEQFGIRIEDIVVVTDSGVRTLTGFDRQLLVKK